MSCDYFCGCLFFFVTPRVSISVSRRDGGKPALSFRSNIFKRALQLLFILKSSSAPLCDYLCFKGTFTLGSFVYLRRLGKDCLVSSSRRLLDDVHGGVVEEGKKTAKLLVSDAQMGSYGR